MRGLWIWLVSLFARAPVPAPVVRRRTDRMTDFWASSSCAECRNGGHEPRPAPLRVSSPPDLRVLHVEGMSLWLRMEAEEQRALQERANAMLVLRSMALRLRCGAPRRREWPAS